MTNVNQRAQRHRDALRAAGLRPIQIWVPATRRKGLAAECRRQSLLASQADSADLELELELDHFMDFAAQDIDGWNV